MEKLIFVLLIAAVYAAPRRDSNPIPGYVCPADDVVKGCLGPKDCLYPNPKDCHSFIQCTAAGLAYVMPCAPKDLVYDDSQKQCDWQSDSNVCKVPTEAPTTEASTTEAPTTEASTTEAPTTEASTTEASVTEICTTEPETETPTTNTPTDSTTDTPIDSTTDTPIDSTTDASTTPSSGFVCPEEDIADTGCKGPTDCLYPNPENCNSFIQCVPQPDGSGEPVVMPCPAGLEWNDNKKQCDYPPDSTCPKRPY